MPSHRFFHTLAVATLASGLLALAFFVPQCPLLRPTSGSPSALPAQLSGKQTPAKIDLSAEISCSSPDGTSTTSLVVCPGRALRCRLTVAAVKVPAGALPAEAQAEVTLTLPKGVVWAEPGSQATVAFACPKGVRVQGGGVPVGQTFACTQTVTLSVPLAGATAGATLLTRDLPVYANYPGGRMTASVESTDKRAMIDSNTKNNAAALDVSLRQTDTGNCSDEVAKGILYRSDPTPSKDSDRFINFAIGGATVADVTIKSPPCEVILLQSLSYKITNGLQAYSPRPAPECVTRGTTTTCSNLLLWDASKAPPSQSELSPGATPFAYSQVTLSYDTAYRPALGVDDALLAACNDAIEKGPDAVFTPTTVTVTFKDSKKKLARKCTVYGACNP